MPKGNPLTRTVTKERWNRKTYAVFQVRIRKDKDSDILRWLEGKPSRNGYIVDLIRKDMEGSKK